MDKINVEGPVYVGGMTKIEDGATIVGPAMIGPSCHICAGATIDWHRKTIDKERNESFKRDGKDIHAAMEAETPNGPTSLFVLPHMAGTGTPHMDGMASGAILLSDEIRQGSADQPQCGITACRCTPSPTPAPFWTEVST